MTALREEFIDRATHALQEAEIHLPADVVNALKKAHHDETNPRARGQLHTILENVALAARHGLPICQDTGTPIFYVRFGTQSSVDFDIHKALRTAVQNATILIPLRENAVHPLTRRFTHLPLLDVTCEFVDGNHVSVDVLIKGAGSENASTLQMLNPSDDVRKFTLEAVTEAGAKPCPPTIVGIGIGSTFSGCAWLAKKALFRRCDERQTRLERELLRDINMLGIGPMGLGGKTTALKVSIEMADCHTASLPIAINLQCWAHRRASFTMNV